MSDLEKTLRARISELEKRLESQGNTSDPITIPNGWKEEWTKHVMSMWSCVRKHDSTIPDDQLDFMRNILLAASK